MTIQRFSIALRLCSVVLAGVAAAGLVSCRSGAQRAERNPKAVLVEVPAGRLSVEVQNENGSVSIFVDEKATMASILARPMGGGRANPEFVVSDLVDDPTGAVLRVVSTRESAATLPVDITVRVPACSGVRVRSSGGPIEVKGVSGAIDIVSGGTGKSAGSVVVSTGAALTMPVTIHAGEGHVMFDAGPGTAGVIEAIAPLGGVRTEILGSSTEQMRQTPSGWTAKLGGSENPIRLTSDRGSITVRVGRFVSGVED